MPERKLSVLLFLVATCWCVLSLAGSADESRPLSPGDAPIFRWQFTSQDSSPQTEASATLAGAALQGRPVGKLAAGAEGPRPPEFPDFSAENLALGFPGNGASIRFTDPGDESLLDRSQGSTITLEAWVNLKKLSNGQQVYIVGKGRTRNPGFAAENQNYALRLSGAKGEACLSFLFRDAVPAADSSQDFHRWNSKQGFSVDTGWHHVAVSYRFGEPESIAGYIDGQKQEGLWDYGGPTQEAPVVDNDELWIGTSLGGNDGNSFNGAIKEVAIYDRAISPEWLAARYRRVELPSYASPAVLPPGEVLVEVFHGIPGKFDWKFRVPEPFEQFTWPGFVLIDLPQVYNNHGVRADRSNPLMVRLSGMVTWPAEEIRLRIRSRSGSIVRIDNTIVGTVPFPRQLSDGSDGEGGLYPVPGDDPAALHDLATGDQELLVTFRGTGQPQRVQFDLFAGGNKRRPEMGEALLAWTTAAAPGMDQLITFDQPATLSNGDWWPLAESLSSRMETFNRDRRMAASQDWLAYWNRRHQSAREIWSKVAAVVVPESDSDKTGNAIDRFIAARLKTENAEPLPLVDDWSFLRRATLDVIGTVPTPEMARAYFADPPATRRVQLIDRLLQQPGWADHWVSYWQDVLAENPNVINPTLNNSGPFRWWLHESFSDNKPFDQFATELILMEGSTHYGGPAGFGLATQNDSPMAAKAHVLAQSFLGMEMKCARCHDAPYHDFAQKDLFSIAAMLDRKPVTVPATSTIPGDPAALQSLMVKVTLKPGEPVPPEWPFAEQFSGQLATDVLLNPNDRREQLAAIITAPENHRFNQVIVNRLWRRYFGRGLVEPVDDWESAAPSHPEMLQYLEQQWIALNYDLKAMARLMLTSQLYQRQNNPAAASLDRQARLFRGPSPRRLSAEQLVDSLFAISGKPINVEPMNIDVDGMRSYESSLNLGVVRRAWQFSSLSNERDRPSLALPGAQTVVDVLETFGWRSARPDPITVRPQETTVLQPAILANGVVGKRVTQLSDDSRFTALALTDQPLDALITQLTEAILTRPATPAERTLFHNILEPGYAKRVVPGAVPVVRTPRVTSIGVAWTNHLHPEANERKLALKHTLDAGDPPTQRLTTDWRERAEDVVWSLLNSPEFVFIP